MEMKYFPTIDPEATGKRIAQLRTERGLSVKDLQHYFGFEAPQAIYKWQNGAALPSVDNLLALSVLLEVSIDSILVTTQPNSRQTTDLEPEGSVFLRICRKLCVSSNGFTALFPNKKQERHPWLSTASPQLNSMFSLVISSADQTQPDSPCRTCAYHPESR